MKRYAVKIRRADGAILYDSIGRGLDPDPQNAHLHTRYDLAEIKVKSYRKQSRHYVDVNIVEVEVLGLE